MRGLVRKAVIPVGLALFLLGCVLHLHLLQADEVFLFGDWGDGLFNLWVMDHVARAAARCDPDVLDGRIFWPQNEWTLLWSDILAVPSAFYGAIRTAGVNRIRACWAVAMVLALLGYAAYWYLYALLLRIARERLGPLPAWTAFLAPCFAYLAAFSSSRLLYFVHFQNLSSLWLFTLLAGALGYWHTRRSRYFALMALSELLLLYSAPYFAVLGICFILVWLLFQLFMDPREIAVALRRHRWLLAAIMPPFLVLAAGYWLVGNTNHPAEVVYGMSMEPSHLVVPHHGLARRALEGLVSDLPQTHAEIPAYLGAGILLALPLVAVWRTLAFGRWLWEALRRRSFWIAFSLVAGAVLLSQAGRGGRGVAGWVGVVAVITIALLFIRRAALHARREPVTLAFAFLAVCAFIAYGLADGPRSRFVEHTLNPSIWGALVCTVPGVGSIRAVGRLAVIGQGLLLAILLLIVAQLLVTHRGRARIAVVALTLGLAGVQFVDQWGAGAFIYRRPREFAVPTPAEREWFAGRQGPLAVFPSRPVFASTYPMLYFVHFPDLYLMNGYSARVGEVWQHVMDLGGGGRREPTEEQLVYVRRKGCTRAVVLKWRTYPRRLRALREGTRPILFESERFLVLDTAPRPAPRATEAELPAP